jgi:hypothetical protein
MNLVLYIGFPEISLEIIFRDFINEISGIKHDYYNYFYKLIIKKRKLKFKL